MSNAKNYREKYETVRGKSNRLGQIYHVIIGFLGVGIGIFVLYYVFIQLGFLDKVKATDDGLVTGIVYAFISVFILILIANFCRSLAMFLSLQNNDDKDKAIKLCVLIDSVIRDSLACILGLALVGVGIYVLVTANIAAGIFVVVFGLVPIAFTVNDVATAYIGYKEYDYSLGDDQNEKYQRLLAYTDMLPSLAAGSVFALVPLVLLSGAIQVFVEEGPNIGLLIATIFMSVVFGGVGIWILVYTLNHHK